MYRYFDVPRYVVYIIEKKSFEKITAVGTVRHTNTNTNTHKHTYWLQFRHISNLNFK